MEQIIDTTSISDIKIKILEQSLFYGNVLVKVQCYFSDRIRTACVGIINKRFCMKISEKFWNNLRVEQKIGLMKHELLHLIMKHYKTAKHYEHKKVYNYAADIEINQFIPIEELPPNPLLPDSFPSLNLMSKMGAHYYYTILEKYKDEINFNEFINDLLESGDFDFDLDGFDEVDIEDLAEAEDFLDKIIKKSAKKYGKGSDSVIEKIKPFYDIEVNRQAWTSLLRNMISRNGKTYLRTSMRRESKRFSGEVGHRIIVKNSIVAVIDTSYSIHNDNLAEFFQHLLILHRMGVDIYVIEADDKIQKEYWFKGNIPDDIKGRGGTSFEPAILKANEINANTLVYFTDGYASVPEIKANMPIIWVISEGGITSESDTWKKLQGKKLLIKNIEI